MPDLIRSLSSSTSRSRVCFAQVQRDFEELPQGAVFSLRDSLLTLLVKYSKWVCTNCGLRPLLWGVCSRSGGCGHLLMGHLPALHV